jgi:small subunit ribosomal protein S17
MAKGKKDSSVSKQVVAPRRPAKEKEGLVVSDKMDKTIVVAVVTRVKHPLYGKYVRQTTKFFAHDEKEETSVGDLVRISQTSPISSKKRWRLREIVRKAV